MKCRQNKKLRLVAAILVAAMAVMAVMPAAGAVEIDPVCDEAYYVTLDCYGEMVENSVVKSYLTNGAASITDYGKYSAVDNLTNDLEPKVNGDSVVFDFGEDVPERFYFQGQDDGLFKELPWSIAMAYRLNGLAAKAEDLGGKSGTVEIDLDLEPNTAVSDYMKNNYVLAAMAVFNDDDILSISAPGAQVQLIGNLRVVLYLTLPGEEQHYTMTVGSEDFSFGGMTFLMMPATLQQLDKIADLREAKATVEDSYNAVGDSMEVILDSISGMGDSLNTAADGLDSLNEARGIVADGSDGLYASADAALSDLDILADSMGPLSDSLTSAGSMLTETTACLSDMTASVTAIKPLISDVQADITKLQNDTASTRGLITTATADRNSIQSALGGTSGDLDKISIQIGGVADDLKDMEKDSLEITIDADKVSGGAQVLAGDIKNLQTGVTAMNADVKSLAADMNQLRTKLTALQTALNDVQAPSDVDQLTVQGMTIEQIQGYVTQVEQLRTAYDASGYEAVGVTFEQFMTTYFVNNAGYDAQIAAETAAKLNTLWQYSQTSGYADEIKQAETINGLIDTVNGMLDEISGTVTDITDPTADLMGELSNLSGKMGYLASAGIPSSVGTTLGDTASAMNGLASTGDHLASTGSDMAGAMGDLAVLSDTLSDSMARLSDVCGTMTGAMDDMSEYDYLLPQVLDHLDSMGDTAVEFSTQATDILDSVQQMDSVINKYEPTAQTALKSLNTMSTAAMGGLRDMKSFLSQFEGLLKSAGDKANEGMEKALEGIADSLRTATDGLGQTDTLKDAKNTVSDLIDDKWNAYTGEDNNMLLMDAGAEIQSLTSDKNLSPESVQIILRSAEIKQSADKTETQQAQTEQTGGFFSRIGDMFKALWDAIKGIFGK